MRTLVALIFLLSSPLSVSAEPPALDKCQNDTCLRRLVPYNSKTPPSLEACTSLDGRKVDDMFGEDLGVLCRLVISRAMAGQRAKEACIYKDGDIAPDYNADLPTDLLARYNELLVTPHIAKGTISTLPSFAGHNKSTIHGSYIYNRQTNEQQGQKRKVSFAAYFCITDKPLIHYTPYFAVLKIEDKPIEQAYINDPPVLEPVFHQFAGAKNQLEVSGVVDLNGDGNKDVVFLLHDFMDGYSVNACLYQAGQPECKLVPAETSVDLKERLSSANPGLVISGMDVNLEFVDEGKPVAAATYRFSGSGMQVMEKKGNLKDTNR